MDPFTNARDTACAKRMLHARTTRLARAHPAQPLNPAPKTRPFKSSSALGPGARVRLFLGSGRRRAPARLTDLGTMPLSVKTMKASDKQALLLEYGIDPGEWMVMSI